MTTGRSPWDLQRISYSADRYQDLHYEPASTEVLIKLPSHIYPLGPVNKGLGASWLTQMCHIA